MFTTGRVRATFAYNLRFPGQYYQAETGLNQNWFRDYDPTVGRYLESDPMGLRAGLNTYAYVRSQPALLTDPRGLDINPKQTCIDGLGIGCKGQQNNPNVPGEPAKPAKPKLPDTDYCAKHSIELNGCLTCCAGIAVRATVLEFNWHGLCNVECERQYVGFCPRTRPDADPVLAAASVAMY